MKIYSFVKCYLTLILYLLLLSDNSACAQTSKLPISVGRTYVVHGQIETYHSARKDMKSNTDLKEGDIIKIELIDSLWVNYKLGSTEFDKWFFLDSFISDRISFEQQDGNAIRMAEHMAVLEKQLTKLESLINALEGKIGHLSVSRPAVGLPAAPADPVRPSNTDVEAAIAECLTNEVPISWVGNLMGGGSAQLATVEIQQTGNYNVQQNYWPTRIRCAGRCKLNDPFNPNKWVSFDETGEFKLFQDDYGKWKASLAKGMFQ